MFNQSFSKKLISVLGIVSTITILTIGISSYLLIKRYITQRVDNELSQRTKSASHLVQTAVNVSIRNYLRGLTEKVHVMVQFYYRQYQQGILTEEEAYQKVRELILDPEYGSIGKTGYLAGVNGKGVLVMHPKSEGVDASKLEFMQEAITMKNGYLEYMWKNVGEETERAKVGWLAHFEPWDLIIWASSYKNEFHTLVNVDDFKDQLLSIKLRDTGYAYVMDSQGTLLVHPTLAGQSIYDSQDAQGNYFIREICRNKTGQIIYPWQNPDEKNPREKIVYYTYFEDMDWIIACGVYLDELYAPIKEFIYTLIVIMFGIFMIVIILSIIWGSSLSKPIKQLANFAQYIGKGQLNVKIPIVSKDEIGYLSAAFNGMVDNLGGVIAQVQQSGIQVTSSATELSAAAKEQEAIMDHQIESIQKVVQLVQEISDVTAKLAQTMHQVASKSQDTVGFASSGQTELIHMGEAMQHMEDASKSISTRLQAINEKADNITTVVTTITKVADQTNLLSLNAAIEAEKAGEFGRGFTVVAREIRRLADQTAVATLDIEQMVREMQSAVSAGVMEMDKFMKEVWHSAEDVEKISAQLTRIIEQVQTLSPSFEEVNIGMEQQSGNAEKIKGAIVSLSEEMWQTAESLRESFLAIEQLNEAARDLQDQVSRFKVSEKEIGS